MRTVTAGPAPRSDLADVTPYRTSDLEDGEVLLYANENPYPLPEAVMRTVRDAVASLELNRYPAPDPAALRGELAGHVGAGPGWIWVGTGSNEVLLQACLAYGGAGRTALLFGPTYEMHHRQARVAGTEVVFAARRERDFSIDVDAAIDRIERDAPEIVFVCSPNNPTGTLTPMSDIRRIVEAASGLVVLDEAYAEFSGASFVAELGDHPNVLCVRTLSKAFRLAGLRVGYGVASPELLEAFARVHMPYSVSAVAQAVALAVLRHRSEVLEPVAAIVAERDRITRTLADFPGVEAFDSAANFVLFRVPEADRVFAALAEKGVVLRNFTTKPGCQDCLRVTVGLPEENEAFLRAFADAL